MPNGHVAGRVPLLYRPRERARVKTMKRAISFAVLSVLFAIPAHAQRAAGGSSNVSGPGGGGAGNVGGGTTVSFHVLPAAPPAQFQTLDFSGVETVTSYFLPFDKGIAMGRSELDASRETLAQAAAENRRAERAKAKFLMVQDAVGNVVLVRQ
jgi:hypothetical protein